MKLEAKLQNKTYPLEVKAVDEANFQVQVGEKTLTVNVFRPEDHILSLIINGRSYEVYQMETAKGMHFQVGTQTYEVTLVDPLEAAMAQATGAKGGGVEEVTSPMPGRVVSVAIKAGDTVEAGQGVIVVEAMKMENELVSPMAGKVTAVKVKAGEAVDSGQVLVVIEGSA